MNAFAEVLADLQKTIDNHAFWCPVTEHLDMLGAMSVTIDAGLQSSLPDTERYAQFAEMQQLVMSCTRDYL